MTQRSGATVPQKPPRGSTVSSPTKRGIVSVGIIDTPEGPALQFRTIELTEARIVNGQISMEASDPESDKCPRCKERLDLLEPHRDSEGEITHWTVKCDCCGLAGVV